MTSHLTTMSKKLSGCCNGEITEYGQCLVCGAEVCEDCNNTGEVVEPPMQPDGDGRVRKCHCSLE